MNSIILMTVLPIIFCKIDFLVEVEFMTLDCLDWSKFLNILKEDSSESVDSVDYSGEGGPIELLEKGPAKYCKKEQKVCNSYSRKWSGKFGDPGKYFNFVQFKRKALCDCRICSQTQEIQKGFCQGSQQNE